MADRRGLRILLGTVAALAVAGMVLFVGVRRSDDQAHDFVVPDLQGNAVRLSILL